MLLVIGVLVIGSTFGTDVGWGIDQVTREYGSNTQGIAPRLVASYKTTVPRVFFFFASFLFSLSRNKEKEMKRKPKKPIKFQLQIKRC
ncbi:hypothetical protein, partial [Nitratifractor sp.]|uniref:hypothetical protein n=1 Tax=Nitratifractor sp. TaxID=2268144 RepID=UPI0025EFCCE0